MTERLNASAALRLVPGWDPGAAVIEQLQGGLTNRTYRVRCRDGEFVLRLDSPRSGAYRFDRSRELCILRQAGKAGIAPEVIHADPDRGMLLTRFLEGRAWDETDLRSTRKLEALADLLRRVHALPSSGTSIDMSAAAIAYQDYLDKGQYLHTFSARCVEVIATVAAHADKVCCHNDVVAANLIAGRDLRLIDWEYACDNDPMFDLASAIGFHDLDESQADALLDAYAGGADAGLRERLAEQVRVYDAIQWLWLATRQLAHPGRRQARRLEELQQRIR